MPYQNLDSEVMVAFAIWLLAISIFASMLLLAVVEIISENRAKMNLKPKTDPKRLVNLIHIAVNSFQRK